MKKALLVLFLTLFLCQLRAANYYWVGGAGNWSDLNHWRLGSSTGSIPSIVPSSTDNVFFGSYSDLGSSRTVTVNANAFCNNMTWESGIPSVTAFQGNGVFTVTISGNLTLSPNVTYNLIYVVFAGGTPATLTTGGTVLGTLNMVIDKPGSGLALADSLDYITTSNSRNTVVLNAGYFNAQGKKIKAYGLGSNQANTRSLNISNATIEVRSFGYSNINKTLNATGSLIKTSTIVIDGGAYNIAEVGATDNENSAISNTTFHKITFTNPSLSSLARIGTNNTVDSIFFMGSGSIRSSNNTVGYVRFAGSGAVGGSNNVIHYADARGPFQIIDFGNNTFDTLLTAPNKNILITGTNTINQYLRIGGTACDGFTEVTGSSSGTLNFGAGSDVDMDNVLLTSLAVTGTGTPLTVNGIDNGGNTGFVINAPAGSGTTLYWVGGAGDWGEPIHWSFSSGGAGGACVPFATDNVVFDANSGFTAGNNTVTTSANAYCNNMTWAAGVGTATFNESGTYIFRIYGSLVMQSAATLNALMEFHGSNPASITTNGNTTGGLQFIIAKINDAVVTLSDNWSNSTGGSFVHRSGGVNLAGRTINLVYYASNINSTRSVDISNATLNFIQFWDYRGTGKSLAATGSYITAPAVLVDGLSYPWVDATASTGSFVIGATFGQLTFTNTSAVGVMGIGGNNTIRRLEYKGTGVVNAGGNNIDTLILAGSRNYTFTGTNTINKYFKAQSAPCAGLSEIKGNPTGTLAFASGATVDISNVYMQNMTATGPMIPIAFNGADAGGNTGWTINAAAGSARYWVGGAGDWNDPNHWSATSGGASGSGCVPTVYDDVYFDVNSGFTAASKTVTINNGNAYCRNVNWTGAANNPTWSKSSSWNLEVWGDSLITTSPATFNLSPTLKGSNPAFMKGSAPSGNFDIEIDKTGGSLTLLNDYSNTESDFQLRNGAFNAPGRTLNIRAFDNLSLANASSIDISNATINASAHWRYDGSQASHALNAVNSVITTINFIATGFTYNKVSISGTSAGHGTINSTAIDSLIFTNTSTTSSAGINGANNVLNFVEYKGSGGIYGTGNTIDTLIFFPGNIYTLTAGTNTTITGEWYGSGTPCSPTEIISSSTTSNATVTKNSGDVSFDYIRLRRITAAGTASPFEAGSHTTNLGNNTNWNIAPYDGAAPIEGLGADTMIAPGAWPYVLTTDRFFGAPTSQYTWNDGSTADSLEITGPGTYSVNVSFPDGCAISDEIMITEGFPLPVDLVSFTVSSRNCESILQWKADNAVGFSHFVVETSKDGNEFVNAGMVAYNYGTNKYSFTDKTQHSGTTYYRLKCVDVDERYKYSAIVAVNANCRQEAIQVYPLVTRGTVKVVLPQVYEKARMRVINTAGQPVTPVMIASGTVRTMDLQGLPAATYLLQVINNGEIKNFKIIKQ